MSSILIGQYDDFATADAVIAELHAAGISAQSIERFHLNAPGKHDVLATGGDEDEDRDAHEGGGGAVAGAAMGAAAGLALGAVAIPIVGPFAAAAGLAIGAYTGSFAGAVTQMGDDDHAAPESEIPMRPAGVRVAVAVVDENASSRVERALRHGDVKSIELATGNWEGGRWADFDPVSTPHWIVPPRT
jgi:hypothetical protein